MGGRQRACESMQGHLRVCEGMKRTCKDVQKCASVCEVCESVKVCARV